jgi:hypothetical protein
MTRAASCNRRRPGQPQCVWLVTHNWHAVSPNPHSPEIGEVDVQAAHICQNSSYEISMNIDEIAG